MLFFFSTGSDDAAAPVAVTPGVEMTGLDLVREALLEIGVVNPTQDLSGDDSEYGLSKLNRLFDRWNANRQASFATTFAAFTLTASQNPHTIGPSGDFEVTNRPSEILAASLIVGDSRYPLRIRNQQWYSGVTDPESTSDYPTDLYFEPAVPDGKIYLYPLCSAASELEIWTRGKLNKMELTDTIAAPDGYRDAIVKTLAEDCIVPFKVKDAPPLLHQQAREARALIFNANLVIPSLCTRDSGLGGGGGFYDYRTGRNE